MRATFLFKMIEALFIVSLTNSDLKQTNFDHIITLEKAKLGPYVCMYIYICVCVL